MQDLSQAMHAFWTDLDGADERNVTVVVMSEFGRNLSENASRGTDHGHGGLMLVLGRAVAGGRVIADWPGLAHEQLWQGQDLAVTIDYRDILSEILSQRLGATDLAAIFSDPSYQPIQRGVLE